MKKHGAKILILDIETMAALAWVWKLYDVNIGIDMIEQDDYMLCWCAKWLGSRQVLSDSIHNYPKEFKKDKKSDFKIAQSLHKIMDEADIIVTHNGNRFDLKWANELFLRHGLGPTSTYRSIDTLAESKANFKSLSYKLQYRLMKLKIGEKLKHEGFNMWKKFASGNRNTRMIKYCKQDVSRTEEFYLLIRAFIKNHPNLGLYTDDKIMICPNCEQRKFQKKGFAYTNSNKFQRYICLNCGKNVRDRHSVLHKNKKAANVVHP